MKNDHNITFRQKWKALLILTKFKVSIAVMLSAFAGYVLYSTRIEWELFAFSLGLLLIIAASSAINHIQERKYDRLMPRTANRPLPSGMLSLNEALLATLLLTLTGSVLLLFLFPVEVWLASLLAAFWYNGIYTPLKRKTSYAIIPGSMVGAIPPFIGYMAAGGFPFDRQVVVLAIFFFIGQIPHFWLLMKKYHVDYQKAGYPVINEKMNEQQINRMITTWMTAGIASALLVSLAVPFSRAASFIIMAYCLYFIFIIGKDLLRKTELQFGKNFLMLNMLYLLVMLIIIVDFTI